MNDDQLTRLSLLQRLKNGSGDRSSDRDWEEFYRQYGGLVLRFCHHRGLDEWNARDVLQETMVLIMRKLPHFEYDPARGRFRNWLLALVAGKVRDAMRRAQRAQTVSLDDPASDASKSIIEKTAAPGSGCAQELENAWMQSLVEEALARIQRDPKTKPETLAVFRASLDGQAVADVARAFGLQPNTVYQIKDRLLKRLRAEIASLESPLAQPAR